MQKKIIIIVFIILVILMFLTISRATFVSNLLGVDWWLTLRPATQQAMRGASPYAVNGFFSPPWELIPLSLIANLPISISIPILFILNLAGYIWAAIKLGMDKFAIPFFIILSGALMNSFYGNIDGLVVLGLLLPPWLGLIVLMCKPQIGIPIMAYIVLGILLSNVKIKIKMTMLFRILLPLAVCILLSVAIYGNWYTHAGQAVNLEWNTAPWPWGIPLGMWLIWIGVIKKDVRWALISIPFLTPYIGFITWAVSSMGLLSLTPEIYKTRNIKIDN